MIGVDRYIWNLESGIWNLEFGVWNLVFGIWNLEFGIGIGIGIGIFPLFSEFPGLDLPVNNFFYIRLAKSPSTSGEFRVEITLIL